MSITVVVVWIRMLVDNTLRRMGWALERNNNHSNNNNSPAERRRRGAEASPSR